MANRQDILIFKALKKAYFAERIEILMDMSILNRYGSFVYNPWNNVIPLVVPCLFGLMVMVFYNIFYGLLTIILGFFVHKIYVKIVVEKIIRDKVLNIMFKGLGSFQYIWSMGVLTILMKNNKMIGCKSKEGDLKSFVALNLFDLMTDKTIDNELKMPPPPPDLDKLIKEAKDKQAALKAKENTKQEDIKQIEEFDEEYEEQTEEFDNR